MTTFRTQIESHDVSVYDLDKHFPQLKGLANGSDYEIEPHGFEVAWQFEIEAREWGIKGMSWYVTDMGGFFDIVYFDAQGDEKEREQIEFKPDLFRDRITMDIEPDEWNQIMVNGLEIHYSDMNVSVQ